MAEYETAGLTSDRSYRFMNDMACRLQAGRCTSTGQRKYLDDLIDQGVPSLKNEERVKEILAAAHVDGMQHVKNTLEDFAFKIGKGWNLSVKQEKFLANLLAKAEILKTEGRFRPSDEMIVELENAAKICQEKNGYYWQHRPGTSKAYDKISHWLQWRTADLARKEVKKVTGRDIERIDEPLIDQWACDKILNTFKKQLAELQNPKHAEGSMLWTRVGAHGAGVSHCFALIAGSPTILAGRVSYPCLVNGTLIEISTDNLKKRRS
jgi:hypothetical protein